VAATVNGFEARYVEEMLMKVVFAVFAMCLAVVSSVEVMPDADLAKAKDRVAILFAHPDDQLACVGFELMSLKSVRADGSFA